jgi:hypothetical protein
MPRHMRLGDAALPYSQNTASRADAADGHPLLRMASSAARMEFFISLLADHGALSKRGATARPCPQRFQQQPNARVENFFRCAQVSVAQHRSGRALVLATAHRDVRAWRVDAERYSSRSHRDVRPRIRGRRGSAVRNASSGVAPPAAAAEGNRGQGRATSCSGIAARGDRSAATRAQPTPTDFPPSLPHRPPSPQMRGRSTMEKPRDRRAEARRGRRSHADSRPLPRPAFSAPTARPPAFAFRPDAHSSRHPSRRSSPARRHSRPRLAYPRRAYCNFAYPRFACPRRAQFRESGPHRSGPEHPDPDRRGTPLL